MTPNSPRQSVLPGKRWLQHAMTSRLLRARSSPVGCSVAPPAPRNRQEDSPWDPRPPPRLQFWRAVVDLLVHDGDLVARVLRLRTKIGVISWVI
jgi:hypothetical protein